MCLDFSCLRWYDLAHGEMSERFKEPVLKTGDGAAHRGFESHSLRHKRSTPLGVDLLCFEEIQTSKCIGLSRINSVSKQLKIFVDKPLWMCYYVEAVVRRHTYGRVVELVDSLDSGSSVHCGRAGSSPASPTKSASFERRLPIFLFMALQNTDCQV